jgi:F-type H+-transporting ATPase subunit epsilon
VTPEDVVYDGKVRWVQVPLKDGLIGIWPGHAPLIAAIAKGNVQYDTGESVESLSIEKGILRITQDRCAILVGSLPSQSVVSSNRTGALVADLEGALFESLPQDQIQELQKD